MKFYFKRLENYESKVPKRTYFIKSIGKAKRLFSIAFLIKVKIKLHTVPHLKALTRSVKCRGGYGHGSIFKQYYTVMRSTISLHKLHIRRFHVTLAVWFLDKPNENEVTMKCCQPLELLTHF